jgi:hypothetical protein
LDCGLKILSRKVKGRLVVLKVQVPVAGRLTTKGSGLRAVRRTLKRPVIATVKVPLSKAGAKRLRQRRGAHRKLALQISLKLTPARGTPKVGGTREAASKLVFR